MLPSAWQTMNSWIHVSQTARKGASNSIHIVSLLIGGPVQRFKSHLKSLRHHKFEHNIPGVRRTSRVRTPVGLQRQYKSCPQGQLLSIPAFIMSSWSCLTADKRFEEELLPQTSLDNIYNLEISQRLLWVNSLNSCHISQQKPAGTG